MASEILSEVYKMDSDSASSTDGLLYETWIEFMTEFKKVCIWISKRLVGCDRFQNGRCPRRRFLLRRWQRLELLLGADEGEALEGEALEGESLVELELRRRSTPPCRCRPNWRRLETGFGARLGWRLGRRGTSAEVTAEPAATTREMSRGFGPIICSKQQNLNELIWLNLT